MTWTRICASTPSDRPGPGDQLTWLALRYGPNRPEVLHFSRAPAPPDAQRPEAAPPPPASLQVFFHGGYWQELSEAESSFAAPGVVAACSAFAAPGVVAAGSAFAALGYGLAARYRLDEIVAMVRRALLWLRSHAAELGVDPRRIYLSGSSAGAQLVAMCLLEGWLPAPLRPRDVVRGATLRSGVYELEPLRHTSIGDAISGGSISVVQAGFVVPGIVGVPG